MSVRALADAQWNGNPPAELLEEEDKERDQVRLLKTRVALGEMDIVGSKVWDGLSTSTSKGVEEASPVPPTPTSAPSDPPTQAPTQGDDQTALPPAQQKVKVLDSGTTRRSSQQDPEPKSDRPELPKHTSIASTAPSNSQNPSRQESDSSSQHSIPVSHTSREHDKSLLERDQGPRLSEIELPIARPVQRVFSDIPRPQGRRTESDRPEITGRDRPLHMGHAPRRSVSQIARDMERAAANERQTTFETHQTHRSFVTGCTLCSMDYDRMSADNPC